MDEEDEASPELAKNSDTQSSASSSPTPKPLPETIEAIPEKRNLLQLLKNKLLPTRIGLPEPFSFSREVRKPMVFFMNVVGLHEGQSGILMNWRRRIILLFMFACACRRATQISYESAGGTLHEILFNPMVVLSLTRFLFNLSGFLTAFMSGKLYKKKMKLLDSIDAALESDEPIVTVTQAKKVTLRLIWINISLTVSGAAMEMCKRVIIEIQYLLVAKIDLLLRTGGYLSALLYPTIYFLPVECFMTILSQTSIFLLVMDFYLFCTFLRYGIMNVCNKMSQNFGDSPPLVKLQHLDEIQIAHHNLIIAKRNLESCWSLMVFCYYTFTVPCICFLAYVVYRNFQPNYGIVYGIGVWIAINVILLLLLSVPAFQLAEECEMITNSVFDLYQICLKGEDDPRISAKMLILVSQIQANKITISAYNYFPLHRGILLTMFSAIFTYFLILVQFSGAQEATGALLTDGLCKNVSHTQQK